MPAGYTQARERGAAIVALPSIIDMVVAAVREAGTLHEWAAARPDAMAFTGRGAAYRVQLGNEVCVVRHYRRGGMVGRVVADSYVRIGQPRPLRELDASVRARAAGVTTPEVLAAVCYPRGLIYRADIATRFVPDTADLAALTWGESRWPDAQRIAAWRAGGALLRRVFDAGVRHADLNLRNIIVARVGDRIEASLLDLDRARVSVVDDIGRRTMLARFHRSRRKLETAAGQPVGARELVAFEAGLTALSDE